MVEQPIAVRMPGGGNGTPNTANVGHAGSTPAPAAVNTLVKVLVRVHYEVNGGCFYILLFKRLSY